MNRDEIVASLFRMRDNDYAALQAKILPTLAANRIIGVRTPFLRAFAKELAHDPEIKVFLEALPHPFFDENQLHAFLISEEKDYDRCLAYVQTFLPYIDNWATCDQLSPKVFRRDPEKLLPSIREWIGSDHVYTVRFAIGMLMQHFLDKKYRPLYPEMVASVRSDAYYIRMMIAWYFATALAKQYDSILPYLEDRRLDTWTHNKTIQKCVESYRITEEQKQYLRTLRVHSIKEKG